MGRNKKQPTEIDKIFVEFVETASKRELAEMVDAVFREIGMVDKKVLQEYEKEVEKLKALSKLKKYNKYLIKAKVYEEKLRDRESEAKKYEEMEADLRTAYKENRLKDYATFYGVSDDMENPLGKVLSKYGQKKIYFSMKAMKAILSKPDSKGYYKTVLKNLRKQRPEWEEENADAIEGLCELAQGSLVRILNMLVYKEKLACVMLQWIVAARMLRSSKKKKKSWLSYSDLQKEVERNLKELEEIKKKKKE